MNRRCALAVAAVAVALSGTNCPDLNSGNPDTKRVAALRGFGSSEELRAYLAAQATARQGSSSGGLWGWFGRGGMLTAAPGMMANSAEDAAGDGSQTPYSTTNIQEEGVDESDIVKNNGQYIYALRGSTIHIVQAVPVEAMAELATVQLEGSGNSLYLRGDRLVALSQTGWYYGPYGFAAAADDSVSTSTSGSMIGGDLNDGAQVTITVIDVSNPAEPALEATIRIEGSLASSRMIGNLLYVVLTTTPRLPSNPIPLAIAAMPLEDWIPDFETIAADGSVIDSGDVAGWEDFYRPEDPDGYGISTIITLDVDQPTSPFKRTAISADAGTLYASMEALYIADTNYSFTNNASRTDTVIHKLAFVPDGTAYVGSGLVRGRLLNQYSLGEYQDHLRVATTIDEWNGTTSTLMNNVYVLGEAADATLPIVGSIEGIAPGEQIYAARFIGKRGFLVTFRRVDPLFTLDLSNPAQPRIIGELKVPGYSDHIQLLDENHLLTIGKDAQDAGTFAWIQGVQLSVFDVTDFANPSLMHKVIIGGRGSDSEANSNPKAFNYFAARDVVALPMDVYGDSGQGGPTWGVHEFTGLYVYRVTLENGFEFLGRISSDEGTNNRGCFMGYYGFTRGVFIGDTVYSVTERHVKAAALDAVETMAGQALLSNPQQLVEDCYSSGPTISVPMMWGWD